MTKPAITDTHCHLDFEAYQDDLDEVITRARDAGIARILTVGIDIESSERAIRLSETYPEVYVAVGVHPNTKMEWSGSISSQLESMLAHEKVVALGEIGMDYYRDHTTAQEQRLRFETQLEIAGRRGVPVVIHTRNSSEHDRSCIQDVLEILLTWSAGRDPANLPGVLHSFSGSEPEAFQAFELGFFVGITGPVTFKNALDQQYLVQRLPLDKILIETDGPFLTPHPYRGKRNEPAYVRLVAEKIAELKNKPLSDVIEPTSNNAERLFNWSG